MLRGAVVGAAALGLVACASNDTGEAPATTTESQARVDAPGSGPTAESTPGTDPADAFDLPALETEPGPAILASGDRVATDGGRLYAYPTSGRADLTRIDPQTGGSLAHFDLTAGPHAADPEGIALNGRFVSAHPKAVVVVSKDRQAFDLLDPDTLAVRASIESDEPVRFGVPRQSAGDGVWLGGVRHDVDAFADVETARAAFSFDPISGELRHRIDLPWCGSVDVMQLNETTLLAILGCTEAIALVDIETGDAELTPGFSTNAHLSPGPDAVWITWPETGEIARVDRATEEILTLDAVGGGPALTRLEPVQVHAGALWLIGRTTDPELSDLLMTVDAASVELTSRVWINVERPQPAIVDGQGILVEPGVRLHFFDAITVPGTAQTFETERPEPPRPTSVVGTTPDEIAVLGALEATLSPDDPPAAERAAYLEDPATTIPLIEGLLDLAAELGDVELVITQIDLVGDEAAVTYLYLIGGVASPPAGLRGGAVRVDGKWLVTTATLCGLAEPAATGRC